MKTKHMKEVFLMIYYNIIIIIKNIYEIKEKKYFFKYFNIFWIFYFIYFLESCVYFKL